MFLLFIAADSSVPTFAEYVYLWFPRHKWWRELTMYELHWHVLVLIVMLVCSFVLCARAKQKPVP